MEQKDDKTFSKEVNKVDSLVGKRDKKSEIIKGFVEESTKDQKVAVEILFKSGDKRPYFSSPFKIIQIENSIYEWSEERSCTYNIESKKRKLPCNFYYEGNPKAQKVKDGLYPSGYIYKDQLVDGKSLLQRMEIASWAVKEWEKTSRGNVMTEGNVKWVFITIMAIVAVVVVGLVLKGGI